MPQAKESNCQQAAAKAEKNSATCEEHLRSTEKEKEVGLVRMCLWVFSWVSAAIPDNSHALYRATSATPVQKEPQTSQKPPTDENLELLTSESATAEAKKKPRPPAEETKQPVSSKHPKEQVKVCDRSLPRT